MNSRTTAYIGIGVSSLVVVLTVVFDIFPYFVIGIITMLLAIVWFVDVIREFARGSSLPAPQPPPDWHALEQGEIPVASEETSAHARQRLNSSLEIHGNCVARLGPYGLINHPLKSDE